jgi:hypothetical protein
VAHVFEAVALRTPGRQRQNRIAPIERFNRGFFIDTEDGRIMRRVQVELWFDKVKRDLFARGIFTSVADSRQGLLHEPCAKANCGAARLPIFFPTSDANAVVGRAGARTTTPMPWWAAFPHKQGVEMRTMRMAGVMVVVVTWLALGGAPPVLAQQAQPVASVDYMKVAPGQDGAYLDLEQKVWKPVHQARVNAGHVLGWYLYSVMSPSGTHADHNYVTVSLYSGFEATENPYPNELIAKVIPAQGLSDFFKKTNAARELVRSELWGGMIGAPQTPLAKPAQYLNVEYMKVPAGGDSAYVDVEKLWQKMHEVRIKDGTLANWDLYSRIWPEGSDYPYNYATVNGYTKYKDIAGLDFPALLLKANLGMSANELGDRTAKARDLVRGELWVLVDYVQATPK